LKIPKGFSAAINQRTDSTMAKRKRTKVRTTIYKTLYRKLNNKQTQTQTHQNSGALER